jgi:uncharacterized OB-fold protein
MAERPLPAIDDESRPFWDAAREGRLAIQRCVGCGQYVFYPRATCPHCYEAELEWVDASGRGEIHSFTVAHRPAGGWFADKVPYVVALVELDEGVRMLGGLRVDDIASVRVGARVRVAFEQANDEVTIPVWELEAG